MKKTAGFTTIKKLAEVSILSMMLASMPMASLMGEYHDSQMITVIQAAQRQGKTTANVNLRKGAGTNYGIIKTLAKGTSVTILSESNGWMKVKVGKQEGYVSSQYVKVTTISTSTSTPSIAQHQGKTTANVNFRKGAGTNYGIIKTLAKGTSVTILRESNGWMKVKVGKQEGYVSSRYVKVTTTSPSTSTSTPSIAQHQGKTTANVNFRKGAGTNYGIIKTLAKGTSVTILSESNGWMKVKVGKQEGYVSSQYVTANISGSEAGVVKNPNSMLALVNKKNVLDSTYVPSDLVVAELRNSSGVVNQSILLRKETATAAKNLFSDANKAGIEFMLISGYRSYSRQSEIYNNYVAVYGQTSADRFSAKPGQSEHQTGLALDVSAKSVNGQLVQSFATTKEGKWLEKNAHNYGFIISYPEGRETDTGFMYEPWHIRYVGKDAAKIIHQNNWTLEDYLIRK